MGSEEILSAKDKSLAHLRSIYGDDAETVIADGRYGFISGLMKNVLRKPAIEREDNWSTSSTSFGSRLDRGNTLRQANRTHTNI